MPDTATRTVTVRDAAGGERTEHVAVEEPLELRLAFGPLARRSRITLTTTMRTPGHDAELAVGFLFAERIVTTPGDMLAVSSSSSPPGLRGGRGGSEVPSPPPAPPQSRGGEETNVVRVELHPDVAFDAERSARTFTTTSACGVCGRSTLDGLDAKLDPISSTDTFPPSLIHTLPDKLRDAQPAFARTGGLHAAALFDRHGTLVAAREDVGRHNAVDKLVGWAFQSGRVPLTDHVMLVSGRASFELTQKAVAAGAAALAAVGAPSSLAVETAERFGLTLLGFVRGGRFNVYAGAERITEPTE